MNCNTCECKNSPASHAIYGWIELGNGTTTKWLSFIDGRLTLEEAKAEAIRIKNALWKGCVVRCWAE